MTLAYFSGYSHKKYLAKMHACRNHTIASFTPLTKKKKINSCFCPQISSWASL